MIKNLCSLQQMSALLLFIFCLLSFSSFAAHSNSVIGQIDVVKMHNSVRQSGYLQGAHLWGKRDTLLQRAAKTNKKTASSGHEYFGRQRVYHVRFF